MLKVFLVEDECVVREGLRECIDWARYGFEFCGDAPDGELALPQIRKLRPDILITDIKMPFMDGLALSKLVCAELPETKIILISGHNDFEFAQEAIEIGVEQYLLKPVTKSSLLKTLEDVSRKIDEEREQKAYLRRFQQEGREYEQYARRKFFEQVTSGSLRVSEIYEQAKKLQIDIDAEGYTVILLTLQSRGAAEYSQTLADRLEELMAYLLRYGEYLLFRCNLMTYCIIVKGSGAGLNDAVHRCLENIQRRCGGDEALAWYAAVSDPVARLSELPGCYAQAHTILSYRHLLPEQHILTSDVLRKPQHSSLSELDEVDASKADPAIIRSFLQTGMREEIPDFVSEYLSSFGNALNSLLFRQYVLLELRFSAIRAAKSFGYSQEEFLRPLEPAQARAVDADLPELKKSCAAFLRRAIELREEESGNQYKSMLKRALHYIDQNYTDENLSLNAVAKAANISPNYFSGVFSQEMGQTFVEYLTEKRMARAKELLAGTQDRQSRKAITSAINLCENLRERILQITETEGYDARMEQLESNVYILTELIQQYFYTYLYHEAGYLDSLQAALTARLWLELGLVAVGALVLVGVLMRRSAAISRSITRPIYALRERAQSIGRGDLAAREPVVAEDETLQALSSSLEHMAQHLQQQMELNRQEQDKLRAMELALLQSQINPHFLYNTLDTIIWLVETGKNEQAVEMVTSLSNFFRSSLSQGRDIITLGEEEIHVRSYLEIQQVRYRDILRYEIHVQPELRGCVLPKLTLQPLVENALYHGIKLRRGLGCILVDAAQEDDRVRITVRDDGAGMPPERLQQLRQSLDTEEQVGFGLRTVYRRLRLLYGEQCSMELESEPGAGTTVTLRFPIRKEAGA